MRARARTAHHIPDRDPLRLSVGDRVVIGERSDEWPAFVFVTAKHGEGWVPERHLEQRGDSALVVLGYDTTELPLTRGQEVLVIEQDEPSGWWWCRDDRGREGWVPMAALIPLD